jgi:hypothetical protein
MGTGCCSARTCSIPTFVCSMRVAGSASQRSPVARDAAPGPSSCCRVSGLFFELESASPERVFWRRTAGREDERGASGVWIEGHHS